MKNYLKLLGFLKGHLRLFSAAIACTALYSVFQGFQFTFVIPMVDIIFTNKEIKFPHSHIPGFVQQLIDYLNAMTPIEFLKIIPIPVLIITFCKVGSSYLAGYLMNDLSQQIIKDVRNRLYAKIQNLSLDYFSKKRAGELISRITYDVAHIESAVGNAIADLFKETFQLIVFATMVFYIHPKAALVIFIFFPMIGVPLAQIGRKLRKLSKMLQETMAHINAFLLETISGIKVVKAFSKEDHEIKRFENRNHEFYRTRMKSIKRMLLISPITEVLGTSVGLALLYWLGLQVINEELSFGVFAAFVVALMNMISPIKRLGSVNAITQQALAANERIHEVLESMPSVIESPKAEKLSTIQDRISIENVSFKYGGEDEDILKNVNFNIKVGELVAIVGPTGAGKSTLVNLIPRFYDPTSGSVKIDGIDLKNVSFKSLRDQIGIVSQDTFLFNDTLRANIAYGNANASQEEIEEAARKAFAHRFIVKMPNGYDEVIGDRGFRLSGGEKQRLTIARAILKNAPILILDEATSQLDSESEKFIQEALDKLMQGRTVIAIAHRLSTIRKASKIIVLDQGRIVGMEEHDRLLETCQLYKGLYETQFNI